MDADEQSAAEALLSCVNMKPGRPSLYASPSQPVVQERSYHQLSKNLAPLLHSGVDNYNSNYTQSIQSSSSHSRSPTNVTSTPSELTNHSFAPLQAVKKRGRSAEGSSVDDNVADEQDEEIDDASRPLKNTKRAAQNRAAQRAFRERKEQYVRDLERKSLLLDETIIDREKLFAQVSALKADLVSIRARPVAPVAASPTTLFPSASSLAPRLLPHQTAFPPIIDYSNCHPQPQNAGNHSGEWERRSASWEKERAELLHSVEKEHRRVMNVEHEAHLVTQGKLDESRRELATFRREFMSACAAIKSE